MYMHLLCVSYRINMHRLNKEHFDRESLGPLQHGSVVVIQAA